MPLIMYFLSLSGLSFTLLWNIIAVTTAWIKGNSEYHDHHSMYCYAKFSSSNLPKLGFSSRCEDLVSCYNLLHIWSTRSLFVMVPSTLQSFQVCRLLSFCCPSNVHIFRIYVISFESVTAREPCVQKVNYKVYNLSRID